MFHLTINNAINDLSFVLLFLDDRRKFIITCIYNDEHEKVKIPILDAWNELRSIAPIHQDKTGTFYFYEDHVARFGYVEADDMVFETDEIGAYVLLSHIASRVASIKYSER